MQPTLRQELSLYPAPTTEQGAPTWSLQDPVRNLFFQIDWLTFEVLSRWHLNSPEQILKAIEDETPISVDLVDIEQVVQFLSDNELLQQNSPESSNWFKAKQEKQKTSLWQWLLHHYLFFRIPLWQPDSWLSHWKFLTNPLYSKTFQAITFVALCLGLFQLSRQWDLFTASLVDTFSWQGLTAFAITLAFAKFLHELGHAFTAKRFGCRVPTMGVAFLVLFPMAYTDVNEVWKLQEKRQRLLVGAAGILTELYLAAWSTLLWALLPAGMLKDAAFILASTTWISTLLINTSPFMRFDGYFLVMDWLEIPNLHQRAFAMGRWWLRELLFGLKEEPPEYFSAKRQRGLILFCLATWLYRLILFVGIAIMLYNFLPKPLGPALAAVELFWFIILPMFKEIKVWFSQSLSIILSLRTWVTLMFLAGLIAVAVIPWDQRVSTQAILEPEKYQFLVAPGPSTVLQINTHQGTHIAKNDSIMRLDAPDIRFQIKAIETQLETLKWQSTTAGVTESLREKLASLEAQQQKAQSELAGLEQELTRYQITAPLSGHFYPQDQNLKPGSWLGANEVIGSVVDTSSWQIVTYMTPSQLQRIQTGNIGSFYPEAADLPQLAVTVHSIDRDATRTLPQGMLASTHGGEILVRQSGKNLIPEEAVYKVTLSLNSSYSSDEPRTLRGRVVIHGQARAYIDDFIQTAMAIFIRESVF
ncbi:site-2 protease family protein [Neptuniibacter sp.]|uniref:site-2 protease family protein n=1 Tax=Neptuniibacter sp. TaxID=1962643 RepID=UPI0026041F12|nr:site-2 protease family protein [Neptuniibacter sp.]MCP4596118.1 HlyD family efflux transporter periplasmic adaptor subunit [Neptuniibacter sp.]